jgi:pSer/pThr/pTyr-binding forkhead associated (FHA) protein
MKKSMIKEEEHLYNQTRKSVYSVQAVTTERSPHLPQPPTSRVQSQCKMASSQSTSSDDQGENVQNAPPSQTKSDQQTPMITLTLLHPQQSVAVQTWRFEPKSVIRIGRSRNNEVTLYSAVVSRHHVEIRRKGKDWEVINTGSNGTFCQGKRITRAVVKNGMVIRLASSGPQLQIWTDVLTSEKKPQAPISKPDSEKAQGSFSNAQPSHPFSEDELDQAKTTRIDD